MKAYIKLIIFIIIFITGNVIVAQPVTMKLWKDKAPGTPDNGKLANKEYHNDIYYTYNVTEAEIDVYLPAKEKANGSAVVDCPGGGYGMLAMGHEGRDIAGWLNENGIACIVLKYRLPNDTIMVNKSIGPLQDVQEAIRLTRRNAKEWGINPNKIGVMGFSAGGHVASTASTHFNEKVYGCDTTSARPDFSLLIYPVISMKPGITHDGSMHNLLGNSPGDSLIKHFSNETRVTDNTPPAFLIQSMDDGAVPFENSILYARALKKHNINAELHLYQQGGHGYGLAKNNKGTERGWPDACIAWLRLNGIVN